MYQHILVPTDGSALSDAAAAAAVAFARSCGARLLALSVAEPWLALPDVEGGLMFDPGVESGAAREAAREHVEKVARAARAAGVECATEVALSFAPSEEIVRVAREQQCDLIFMASHGRRGLSRLLAGSQTRQVLLESPVPVMVLRPSSLSHREP